jgi:NADP-dependent 3-hydroxy acid dehydrogenase YdfG
MKIDGLIAITGGAGGIGAACCRYLAECGAELIVVDRNIEQAEILARELAARAYRVDIAEESDVRTCVAQLEKEAGPVQCLINRAGLIQGPIRPFELSMQRWDEITTIDQRGT